MSDEIENLAAPVVDRYNYVYFGFYLYGLGSLMPWNFYITPENYWNNKLSTNISNISMNGEIEQNWMQNFWQNFLSLLCTGIVFIMSLLMQIRPKSWTKECMITVGIGASVIFFVCTALLGIFDNQSWVEVFFWVNLIVGTTLAAFTAVVQNMGMAMAGTLGDKYVQALCSGQGFAGIFAALAYIINLAAAGSPSTAGVSFFCTAAVIAFLALINHFIIIRNEFYVTKSNIYEEESSESERPLIQDSAEPNEKNENEDILTNDEIIKRCAPDIYTVFVTLLITLSVFPGVTASVRSTSTNDEFNKKWFVPVCTFLIFNIGDTFGRFLTGIIQVPSKDSVLQIYFWSTMRVIFCVIFPMCNIPRSVSSSVPLLITQDWLYSLLILVFSISNGYLTTLAFQNAPARIQNVQSKAKAEELVFIGLTSGLIVGSALSFGVKAITLYA